MKSLFPFLFMFFFFFFIFHFHIFLFSFFLKMCFFFHFLNLCSFWHQYQSSTEDVSFAAGAPWRCGVLGKLGQIAGFGLPLQQGREHDSTPIVAWRLLACNTEPSQIGLLLLFQTRVNGGHYHVMDRVAHC